MNIKLSNVISRIVETMLLRGTSNKLLHIRIQASYLHFPHAYRNGNDCSDEINQNLFIHFIFYRPGNYTKVLLLESESPFINFNEDIFELKSYHDSCWRTDGVEHSLNVINQRIVGSIEEKCKELKERVPNLYLSQPNFSDLGTIEILDGDAKELDYDNRKGKIMKNGEYINFIAI